MLLFLEICEIRLTICREKRTLTMCKGGEVHVKGKMCIRDSTHTAQYGIPTIVIGVPVRYAHSSYGILAYQDYDHAVKLAVEIIHKLNRETVEQF